MYSTASTGSIPCSINATATNKGALLNQRFCYLLVTFLSLQRNVPQSYPLQNFRLQILFQLSASMCPGLSYLELHSPENQVAVNLRISFMQILTCISMPAISKVSSS